MTVRSFDPDFDQIRSIQETFTLAERQQQLADAEKRAEALRLRYPNETTALRLGREVGCDAIRRIAASLGAPPEVVDGYSDPAKAWILNHLSETASERINAEADVRWAQEAARPTLTEYAHMEWSRIPKPTRYVSDVPGPDKGKRYVFGFDKGGTCLMPWVGPTQAGE